MSKKLNLILTSGLLLSPIPLLSAVSCSNSNSNSLKSTQAEPDQIDSVLVKPIDPSLIENIYLLPEEIDEPEPDPLDQVQSESSPIKPVLMDQTDFEFELNSETLTATLVGLKKPKQKFVNTTIDIPGKIKHKGLIYSVIAIDYGTFDRVGEINELILPDTIRHISAFAFRGCNFKNGVKWSKWLKYIGYASFAGCTFHKDLILPDYVESIDWHAFQGARILGKLHLSSRLKYIGRAAFYTAKFNGGDLILPDTLESIGEQAFHGCGFTGRLKISNNPKLTTIPVGFFQNNSFSSIEISDNITSINGYAFYNSANGEELFIPKIVSHIGNYAFHIRATSPIKKIIIHRSTYNKAAKNAFDGFKGEIYIIN